MNPYFLDFYTSLVSLDISTYPLTLISTKILRKTFGDTVVSHTKVSECKMSNLLWNLLLKPHVLTGPPLNLLNAGQIYKSKKDNLTKQRSLVSSNL